MSEFDEVSDDTAKHKHFTVRVPIGLYHDLERDSALLGISVGAVGRLRMQTGSIQAVLDNLKSK
jgi:hypothetical protein